MAIRRRTLLASCLSLSGQARAEVPTPRPIRIVVPFPPGGSTDAMGRLSAQKIAERLGTSVIVENRGGGASVAGSEYVHRQSPDGSTLLFSASSFVLARHVLRSVPYDPVTDFTPIGRMATGPLLVLAHPAVPARSLADLSDLARRQPDALVFGVSGPGSASHLATVDLMQRGGFTATTTFYRGSSPALTELSAGNIQLLVDSILSAGPLVREGRVRALAILSPTRNAAMPDIPTSAESGQPGLVGGSWYGLWGPKLLSRPLVLRLNVALQAAMDEPATIARLRALGCEPVREGADDFAGFILEDVAKNSALLRQANYRPE